VQVTRQMVADNLTAYLHHRLTLAELVDWAEEVMQEGHFDGADYENLRDIISRLGLADVKTFGLTWDECEQFLQRMGYTVRVEVVAQG